MMNDSYAFFLFFSSKNSSSFLLHQNSRSSELRLAAPASALSPTSEYDFFYFFSPIESICAYTCRNRFLSSSVF